MSAYDYPHYPYRRPVELDSGPGPRRPVIIVGAGPIGLAAAIDLAGHGIDAVVLDEDETVSVGSRAICWSKRTLEILDRLGVAQRMVDKGVTWQVGRVFWRDQEVYQFDLQPEPGHKQPAFVNLQQYYVEQFLIEALPESVDMRFKSRVVDLTPGHDGVTVLVDTPDGQYTLEAEYVLACDGARSPCRKMLGLDFQGKVFQDRFLIADVTMQADFPTERWFWFEPPFHKGDSALLHKQADSVWRIDLQLGWDADPEEEKKPENVIPRLERMLGADTPFELEWVSVYTFQCRRLRRFRHGRVLFVGDSAHQVSPFGARGGNGGIQDVDNLCWKLAMVLTNEAPQALLDSYDLERVPATDENIENSTRSTDFLTPKTDMSKALRDAVLTLAGEHSFAQRMVNSGRLSLPHAYRDHSVNTPDDEAWSGSAAPGAPAPDAPMIDGDGQAVWLLDQLGGDFALLTFGLPDIQSGLRQVRVGDGGLTDREGYAAARFDARDGSCYLIRPDQHVAARWRDFDQTKLESALQHAHGHDMPDTMAPAAE